MFTTSAPPRARILVPAGVTERRKTSQPSPSGLKRPPRFTKECFPATARRASRQRKSFSRATNSAAATPERASTSESARAIRRRRSTSQVAQHLAHVLARRHLRVVAEHAPLLVDQARDALRELRGRIVGRAVGERQAPVRVGEEREGEGELLREGGVVGRAVEARAEDGHAQGLEITDSVTESASLDRSAGGVGLGEEPEQHLLAAQVLERDAASVVRRGREVRSG